MGSLCGRRAFPGGLLIADAGAEGGSYGGVRNLPGPLAGATKVAAFVASVAPRGAAGVVIEECELNAQPAALILRDGAPATAILLSVRGARISAIFMHADPARLRFRSSFSKSANPRLG